MKGAAPHSLSSYRFGPLSGTLKHNDVCKWKRRERAVQSYVRTYSDPAQRTYTRRSQIGFFRLLRPLAFSFSDTNRKPSSWAVARFVAQRHRSIAKRRATATI